TAPGPPGAEGPVRRIVRETLEGLGRISHDRLGSILCERTGSSASPRIVLDAHMDEVGFLVQSILEDGRLNFVPLGGWWGHVLLAQRVDILTALDGPAEEPRLIPGVIGSKPPHFLRPAEREKVLELDSMYIDVGTSSRVETEALGIRPGDPVVPHAEFLPLAAEGLLSAKAFDDRAGVGVLCEAFLALGSETHPNTVVGVGAVQEEVGSRGAGTASELARPDLAIVLEGAPADDLPGFTERQAVLGKGPQVRFFDPTAISNRRLVGFVERMAAEKGIPIQIAVRRSGGTDAKSIHLHGPGVPTVVISVPARYIHTHVSIIHWRDYLAARDLVVALCLRLDARTVAELTRFDESPAPEPERDRSPHGRGL
ncbi:MAG TPA: M42 family metallopeptidase, partial [Planctomycetota bacterium]|nr:M42 family metallopeptidase [Planctomycetota bacterium]